VSQGTCLAPPETAKGPKALSIRNNKSDDTIIIVITNGKVVRFDNTAMISEFRGINGDGI